MQPAADLDAVLAGLLASRDRDHMQPTIEALLAILAEHPENAGVVAEVGGAYDTDGQEQEALRHYERALALGLSGEQRRKCLLQYGSTLRNLGRFDDSVAVFTRARREFPDSPSLAVFEALTLHAAGRPSAALAMMLELVADRVDSAEIRRYETAIRGNAEYLAALDDEPPRVASETRPARSAAR